MNDKFITINIPNNNKINEFLLLSENEMSKVIELGIAAYNGTIQCIYKSNNDEYKQSIEKMEKTHKIQINEKNLEIKRIKNNMQHLQQEFKEKYNIMQNSLTNTIQKTFQNEINFKQNKIKQLQKEINEKDEKHKNIIINNNKSNNETIEKLLNRHREYIESVRNRYDEKIEVLQNKMVEINSIKENSSVKGKVSELKMFNILTMMFPNYEIEDTHKECARGDFIITMHNEKKILIDNKDYGGNVPKKEIDKFERDIRENNDIYGGVLLSNRSGVARKNDFQIDIIKNKPVIYVCNTNENSKKIKCAIDFLSSIINCETIDLSNKEIQDKIKKISTDFKRKITKLRKNIEKFSNTMYADILDIENMVKNILLTNKINI
tara:strand:+ start:549 stop:1682 length:1134 start_codon:yes stop_codon:yes gene_type:complete